MAAALGSILALMSLVITPGLLFYFDVTPKVAVFVMATAILLPWLQLPRFREGRRLAALLGAQALSLLLSTALSRHAALSLGGTNWRRLGLASWTAVLLFTLLTLTVVSGRPAARVVLARFIAASGLVAATYGILQYFGWDPWLPSAAYHVGEGVWTIVRPPSTLGYATYFATYLLAVVFLGAGLASGEKRAGWKALGGAAALASVAAIVLSGTRSAILGLLCGGVFWLVWFRPRLLRLAAALAVTVAAGTLFYYSPAGAELRSRTRWYREDPRGGARLLLWRDSLRMSAARPLAGYGPETFSAEFPHYQSVALAQAFPDFFHESPHNVLLDALTQQGVPGLLMMVALVGLAFHAAWRARERHRDAGVAAAALASMLVAGQFNSFTFVTAVITYVLIAMLVGLLAEAPPGPRRWRPAVLPACALLAAFALRLAVADRALALAGRALDDGQFGRSVHEYEIARNWQPAGEASDLWYSRRLAVFAQNTHDDAAWRQATAAALRATRTAADPQNAWYSLAGFYAGRNDFPKTEAALRAAIAAAPNWFKPHWILAQALRLAGRLEEAEREAVAARRLDGGRHGEVAATLSAIRQDRRVARQ